MSETPINSISSLNLAGELQRLRALAQNEINEPGTPNIGDDSFSALMKKQVDDVNVSQKHAAKLSELFELGDENVSLVDVMIAGQKSRVAFSALVEVRNKMLSAYQDIMNMQI